MQNLTDAQLERCCRFLCKMRGINPDEQFFITPGFLDPRWKTLREEILTRYRALQVDEALNMVME